MADAVKQDSNSTGLRIAEEDEPGVLPGSPEWVQYEPNSYSDFGGSYTKVARNPINDSRQRSKGELTDLDAAGGFNSDLTLTNLSDLFQGLMFADFRRKGEEAVTNVDGTNNEYDVASTSGFFVGSLLWPTGFDEGANEGLKLVNAFTVNTSIGVTDTGLLDETTGADAQLVVVGHQFGSGVLEVNAAGTLPVIFQNNLAYATGTLDVDGDDFTDGDTFTIGGVTYTLESGVIDAAYEVLIGATDSDTIDNLIAAINGAAGEGTLYGTGTEPNPYVTAAAGAGDTMTVTAIVPGANGNKITTAKVTTDVDIVWTNGATLTGGAGESFIALGINSGEFIFVGGDQAVEQFATAADNGFKRVRTVEHGELTIDKSDADMVTDNGAAKTVRLFFGRVLKNEQASDIVMRTYQLERTAGAPDTAQPDELQAEYLTGQVWNQADIRIPQADKVTIDLSFIGLDHEPTEASEGLKAGDRPTLTDTSALNTSTDFSRINLSKVVVGDEAPDPLFAYATEITLTVNNNCVVNKALGVLGGFSITAGQFQVGGNIEAYFADMASIKAIRDNSDVSVDWILVRDNAGIGFDLPLVSLGDGRLNIQQDQPIKVPLETEAARGRKVHADLDHTLMLVFFDYLPDAADQS